MATKTSFEQLPQEEQNRLLDKLAKLKALSECRTGNVNETATAAATMTRIMLEYQIELADLDVSDEESDNSGVVDETVLPDSYNGFPGWKTTILSALAEANHCQGYSSHKQEYECFTKRTRSRLSVIGTAADVKRTREMFEFCVEEVERLCYLWGPRQSVKRRNDFKRGAAHAIAEKVLAERDKVVQDEEKRAAERGRNSQALALFERKQEAVEDYAAQLGLRSVSRRVRRPSQDAYQAGYRAGSQMNLAGESQVPPDPVQLTF